MASSIEVQLKQLLDEYAEEVRETAKAEMQAVAKETAARLRKTSPKGRSAKHYSAGWTTKKEKDDVIVYNRSKWMLTHLLEKGHATNGGRTSPQPHIEPARQWAEDQVVRRIESKL